MDAVPDSIECGARQMFKLLLLSILPRLAPGAMLNQTRKRLLGLVGGKRSYRAPDLELMLRREVGLPYQPVLFARNIGDQFIVTADLQSVGIDSLQIGITTQQFTLSGWVVPDAADASTTAISSECGWFSSSRTIPPSMDLDHFTLNYHQGLLVFSVPRKHSQNRRPLHSTASITE